MRQTSGCPVQLSRVAINRSKDLYQNALTISDGRVGAVSTWSWIGLFLAGRLIGMTALSISRYPVPKLEDLPEDIRALILEVQEKAGTFF